MLHTTTIYILFSSTHGTSQGEIWEDPNRDAGFLSGSNGKESTTNADQSSIPGLGRYPGEGNGYPLQHSCLQNSMDRGAWQATVHGITELDMTEQLTNRDVYHDYDLED